MKNEEIITELKSLLSFIDESSDTLELEYDKFQVALSNTLRLLDEGSQTLIKMKGNKEDLKAYLIRTSTDLRTTSLNPYEQLRTKIESICRMIRAS